MAARVLDVFKFQIRGLAGKYSYLFLAILRQSWVMAKTVEAEVPHQFGRVWESCSPRSTWQPGLGESLALPILALLQEVSRVLDPTEQDWSAGLML